MRNRSLLLTLLLAVSILPAAADTTRIVQPGDTGAARALGMGNAVTALPDDLEGILWNPAGIARLDGRQMCYFDTPTTGSNTMRFVSYGQPGEENLAGAVSYLRGANDPYNLTETSYIYSFGHNWSDRLSVGANLKYSRFKRDGQGKEAFNGDVGFLFDFTPSSTLGVSVLNLNEPVLMEPRTIAATDVAPELNLPRYQAARMINVGLGLRFFPYVAAGQLGRAPTDYRTKLAVDLFDASDEWRRELRFGVEHKVSNLLTARAGLLGSTPTAGFSVRAADVTLTGGYVFAKEGGHGSQSMLGVSALY